eukprot:SAG31_NODE_25891_length_452_cov_0.728045_1_plen_27_part_01
MVAENFAKAVRDVTAFAGLLAAELDAS